VDGVLIAAVGVHHIDRARAGVAADEADVGDLVGVG
jgi:hypothetical protein